MAADFYIKEGNTSPAYEAQLEDDSGTAVDISGYNKVEFAMWQPGESATVDDDDSGNVSVTDASNGKVKYAWQAGDTGTPAVYYAEWKVEYSDGTTETFPNDGNDIIRIEASKT